MIRVALTLLRLFVFVMDCGGHSRIAGEIDELEFRSLVCSGKARGGPGHQEPTADTRAIVDIAPSQVKDVFNMIDRNGSGGIAFDELIRWVTYERSRASKEPPDVTLPNLIPARARAQLLLLKAGKGNSGPS